jgi:hypothetical protein
MAIADASGLPIIVFRLTDICDQLSSRCITKVLELPQDCLKDASPMVASPDAGHVRRGSPDHLAQRNDNFFAGKLTLGTRRIISRRCWGWL